MYYFGILLQFKRLKTREKVSLIKWLNVQICGFLHRNLIPLSRVLRIVRLIIDGIISIQLMTKKKKTFTARLKVYQTSEKIKN